MGSIKVADLLPQAIPRDLISGADKPQTDDAGAIDFLLHGNGSNRPMCW